jgi:hypothetical protein
MNPFYIGILGAIILVLGAAWPVNAKIHPAKAIKNWLFASGGLLMFIYALLGYLAGGPIFFMILQALVQISSFLMLINAPKKIGIPIISISGVALVIWAMTFFEDYTTLIFIFGLLGIALGYTLGPATKHGNIALTIGSFLIAIFSYLVADWIFFWLNVFFSFFAGYYMVKLTATPPKTRPSR